MQSSTSFSPDIQNRVSKEKAPPSNKKFRDEARSVMSNQSGSFKINKDTTRLKSSDSIFRAKSMVSGERALFPDRFKS